MSAVPLDQRAAAALRGASRSNGAPNLKPVVTNLYADHPPPAYVVDKLVPRGVVTLLGAHGGAGKSVLALTIAAHVATGRTWAGFGIDSGKAVFVSLEDPGTLANFRLKRIADAYGLDYESLTVNLQIVDGSDGDGALAGEVRADGVSRIASTVAGNELHELAKGAQLIVVDNASDAFDGNENDRRMVRAFVRMLAKVAKENNAGLILLAHIDKASARGGGSNSNSYSGSTAWHNSVRSRLALVVDEEGVVELRQEKNQHGKFAGAVQLQWSEHGVLLPSGGAAAQARERDDTDAVLAALHAAWAAGVDVSAARTGPTTTQHVLATFDELPKALQGAPGRRAFWSAIGKLQADGKVQPVEVVTGQRKRKTVLRAPECASSGSLESARANPPHPLCANSAHGGARVCAGSAPVPTEELAQTGAGVSAEVEL